jgi:predicted phosphodiesterase|tara:strand:- start:50 stop:736 length:687 start_codon:yes stop_codon:yes gene_type:complete
MATVLVIGDTHANCMHKKYISFLKRIADQYSPDKIVHIGDLVNWNSISYHQTRLNLMDPEMEFRKAYKQVQQIYKAFPKAHWLLGNHDMIPRRRALDAFLPELLFKDDVDLWDLKGWKVYPRYHDLIIDGVIYRHGDKGKGGRFPAILNAEQQFQSLVQGHHHASGGVEFYGNESRLVFGMQVGCGIDHHKAEMDYGMKFNKKPILGCGIVVNGKRAIFEPMILKNKI